MLQIRPAAVGEFTARDVGKPVLDHDGRHVADVVDVRGGRLYVTAVDGSATGPRCLVDSADASQQRLSGEDVARVDDDGVHLAD